ncbi:ABC transporter permease [Terriglobus saanensis]|uniref:Permease n=1 Tax=Terriglobus saanensis (strain ATCC BAA-1853 / DSM 23119 / SP1PR4) TaxID=401053 RepID=E8V159_TERSS|nr:ABC transporter permease [Terriglobus saanensis]ADV83407.1 permease [Terriglobus saanensis SP1PR4]
MIRELLTRLRFFFNRPPAENLEEEIRLHIERSIEANVDAGMSPDEARRRAMIDFGGVERTREACDEQRPGQWLDVLRQDIRYTLRTLLRDRGFACISILILALGIGANVVVFSVVNTILLRPLPFHDAQQLVWMAGNFGKGGLSDTSYRVDDYEAYKQDSRSLQNLTGFVPYLSVGETKLMHYGEPKPVAGVWVLEDFFKVLGVEPVLGRQFLHTEAVKGGPPAVMLSYPFWQRQFNADPKIIGQTITLDKDTMTVVGVLPSRFDFGAVFAPGAKMDYFIPLVTENVRNWGHMLALVGRMRPGVTLAQTQAEAKTLLPQINASLGHQAGTDYDTKITGLKEEVSGKLRRSLEVLWCAVGLILLIVCVNLSNLLVARAASRSKEFALRVALGAGRARLVRQLMTESLLLSGTGAMLGLLLAYALTYYLAHQGSVALPLMSSVRVDGTALLWTIVLTVTVGLLFGLAPGLKMSAGNLQESLKDSGHGTSDGRKYDRLRSALVISEVALACVLVVGAGLLLRSFLQVMQVDLGFEPTHVSSIRMDYRTDYDGGGAASLAKRWASLQEAIRQIRSIPGVQSAGITDNLPLEHGRSWELRAKGKAVKDGENKDALVYIVTPGYLQTMGMRVWRGRDFQWSDSSATESFIIINRTAARREWPNEDPIGKLAQGIGAGDTRVIGVIDDVQDSSLEAESSPQVYVPVGHGELAKAEVVIRSELPPEVLTPSVMAKLRVMNPSQAVVTLKPVQGLVDRASAPRRFFAILVGIFAALGLILASLGIYGVISYTVARQTQEIGIRMALGASRERVQRGVVLATLRIAMLGVGLGTIFSFVVARSISSLLFGTKPADPLTFVAMIVLLTLVALVAGYLPARRASRVDPMIALRSN